ncbi:Vacuolar protein sorting-associated protein 29 [Coemansia biformis]|uniref:Vacuolar protein sorting-associated protein 29 n=1 Tax=Coemansia biformis TaxID=1286918 RepID=A0A9W8CNA8_9FUNG|nr:Vacuolar protein sorting-associated protein 29 [Coemansia biformis]
MTLVLVLGDIHIPQRAADIPAKFRKLLVPGKVDLILCTGNLADRATLEYLQSITPDVRVVRGESDDKAHNFPVSLRVVEQCEDDDGGGLAVGQGRFFISPGNITGAFSTLMLDPIPSFVLMEIKPGAEIVAYVYQLENDEVVVHSTEYKKGEC